MSNSDLSRFRVCGFGSLGFEVSLLLEQLERFSPSFLVCLSRLHPSVCVSVYLCIRVTACRSEGHGLRWRRRRKRNASAYLACNSQRLCAAKRCCITARVPQFLATSPCISLPVVSLYATTRYVSSHAYRSICPSPLPLLLHDLKICPPFTPHPSPLTPHPSPRTPNAYPTCER
jgi:hypothetical protein